LSGSPPFLVACHGWSASKWVAHALNRHPEIACGHSSSGALAGDAAHQDDNLAPLIPALRAGYLRRQQAPMTDTYAALSAAKPARFTGTVHTYRLRDLPVQADRFSPPPGMPVLNLVRHPLDLVISGAGQFQALFRADLNEFAWTLNKIRDQGLEIIERICGRHRLAPGDYDVLCFFGACVVLGSLRLELEAEDAVRAGPWDYRGTVRMEDVTTSPAAFARMVTDLTGAPELADRGYLNAVFRQSPINRHRRQTGGCPPDRWAALAPWQREGFAAFFEHFALRAPYEAMGYHFRFLDRVRADG